jgi:hypothetical protein
LTGIGWHSLFLPITAVRASNSRFQYYVLIFFHSPAKVIIMNKAIAANKIASRQVDIAERPITESDITRIGVKQHIADITVPKISVIKQLDSYFTMLV